MERSSLDLHGWSSGSKMGIRCLSWLLGKRGRVTGQRAREEEERSLDITQGNLELGSYGRCLRSRIKSYPWLHIPVGTIGPEYFVSHKYHRARHCAKHFIGRILIITKRPRKVILSSHFTDEITEAQRSEVICLRPQAW